MLLGLTRGRCHARGVGASQRRAAQNAPLHSCCTPPSRGQAVASRRLEWSTKAFCDVSRLYVSAKASGPVWLDPAQSVSLLARCAAVAYVFRTALYNIPCHEDVLLVAAPACPRPAPPAGLLGAKPVSSQACATSLAATRGRSCAHASLHVPMAPAGRRTQAAAPLSRVKGLLSVLHTPLQPPHHHHHVAGNFANLP